MSNNKAMELLRANGRDSFYKPTKEIEITRLSEQVGSPFICTVKAIDMNQFKDLMREMGQEGDAVASMDASLEAVRMGLVDPCVTDKELHKQYGVQNWKEFLNFLFLTGEIMELSEAIMDISKLTPEEKKKTKKK